MRRVSFARALTLLLSAGVATRAAAQDTIAARPALVVAGFTRDIDVSSWRDTRVGIGLIAILSDTLFASGLFRLIDEKPQVRQELDSMAQRLWSRQTDGAPTAIDLTSVSTIRPDIIASGRILKFETPGSQMSAGPLHRVQRGFIVEVEVTLFDAATGKSYRARASAETERVALSAVFATRGDRVMFDDTGVGRATSDAIRKAVGMVLADFTNTAHRSPARAS